MKYLLGIVFLVAFLITAGCVVQNNHPPDIPALEYRVYELINQQRNSQGVSSLAFDPALASIARSHSQDMAVNNYYSGTDLQGRDPTERGDQLGYPCRKDDGSVTYGMAEVLFTTRHKTTVNGVSRYNYESVEKIAQDAMNGWMSSYGPGKNGPGKNFLSSTYDHAGIGVNISSDYTVYITGDFC